MNQHQTPSEPVPISSQSLRAKRAYTCGDHPNREAFCLCAKCGKFLCESCSYWISGRRYCEGCIEQDDALMDALRKEVFRPVEKKPDQSFKAPQKFTELPGALRYMAGNMSAFFPTAKDSSFLITYLMALVALVPASIVSLLFHFDEIVPKEKFPEYYDMLTALPKSTLVSVAVFSSAVQILLLDLLLWTAVRIFTSSDLTYGQTGAILHYCLIPLILGALGVGIGSTFVTFLGFALMILMMGTAIRSTLKCGVIPELCIVLSFTLVGTLFKLLP